MDTVQEGLSVSRSDGLTIIRSSADVSTETFKAAVEELGLTGTTDYAVMYDFKTGDEIWVVETPA